KPAVTITTTGEVRGVSFNAEATRVAVGGADNKAAVYGLDGKLVEFFPHDGAVLAVAYHGDRQRVLTASADQNAKQGETTLRRPGARRRVHFQGRRYRLVRRRQDAASLERRRRQEPQERRGPRRPGRWLRPQRRRHQGRHHRRGQEAEGLERRRGPGGDRGEA